MARKSLAPDVLDAVRATISHYRRPRKNPGGERPVAVKTDRTVIKKVTRRHLEHIQRLSLQGAFQYVQITGKYSKTDLEKAKMAFYEAVTGKNGFETGILDQEIARIDQETYDNRDIARNLRAAAKKLRRKPAVS
jgi:hypothetical protein